MAGDADGGDQAEDAGGDERRSVGTGDVAQLSGAVGGAGGAHLVAGDDAAVYERSPQRAELVDASAMVGGTVATQSRP